MCWVSGPAAESRPGGARLGDDEPRRLPEVRHLRGGDAGRHQHGALQTLRSVRGRYWSAARSRDSLQPITGPLPRAAGEVLL